MKRPGLLELSRETAAAHAQLSQANLRFLEFVERNPACLDRRSFAALAERTLFAPFPLQSWPTFVDAPVIDRAAGMSLTLCDLVRRLPLLVFDGDPERIAPFYRLRPDQAELLTALLEDTAYREGLLARGDFVHTAAGFQCLEINLSSNLGGWKTSVWAQMMERVPLFQAFVAEEGLRYRHRDPVPVLFDHVIETAQRKGLVAEEVNVAFLVPAEHRGGAQMEAFGRQALAQALARRPADAPFPGKIGGQILVGDVPDLSLQSTRLMMHGRRVHALVEQYEAAPDRKVFHSLMSRQVSVHNGPVSPLLRDKRNLALLSQHQDAPFFNEAERACIAAHVPWTRIAARETAVFRGEEVWLPDLLAARQRELVIKPADSLKGAGVHVGRCTAAADWDRAAAAALAGPDPWVVQEYVESLPYLYQCGEEGAAEHDVVWGFFAFGNRYGGGFLRMMPKGGKGVVNAAQGASEGVILEVEPQPGPYDARARSSK